MNVPGGWRLLGIGTALPPHVMSQIDAADLAEQVCCATDDQARLLKALYRRAGVETRHTVLPHRDALKYLHGHDRGAAPGPTTAERMDLYQTHATPLAVAASQRALEQSGAGPESIAHLVTVSCTGFASPGTEFELIEALQLSPTVERTHIGFMGCHGALNGLRVARALAHSTPGGQVLLCAVEACSLHYRFPWDPERLVGNVLFADGAAAVVGRQAAEDRAGSWSVAATGSCLLPDCKDAMSWRIGDRGFEMTLSPRVPDLLQQHLKAWLSDWLLRQGLAIADVGSWAVHPGGTRILTAVETALGLTDEALSTSRAVLRECGNMSSPTVLFIVDRLRRQGAALPCVALAFGPGLVAEAVLFVEG